MAVIPIATVASIDGKAFVESPDGTVTELKIGDVVYDGQLVFASEGGYVELTDTDGDILRIDSNIKTAMTTDLLESAPGVDESAVEDQTVAGILQALEQGQELSEVLSQLESTAAGAGGATGEGHGFVRLDRVEEETTPSTIESTGFTEETTTQPEDEDPLIPENEPPTATLSDRENNDSEQIAIDVSGLFTDVDSDPSGWSFTAAGLPPGLSISSDGVISGTLDSDASDKTDDDNNVQVYPVTITLNDGDGGVVEASFNWAVNNPFPDFNDEGEGFYGAGDEGITAGTVVASVSASNPDSDVAHVYSIVGGNDTLFSIDQDGDISVTQDIDDDEVGQYVLTVQVDDEEGGTDLATVTIDLNNVNDDPEGELPDQEDNDSDAISIDVSGFFSDVDSDQSGWSFSSSSLPPGLSISSAGVISGTIDSNASDIPDNDDNVQVYTVTVTLDDGDGGSVDATFDWTINNLAPEFDDNDQGYTGGGDEGITAGSVVASVSASNPDSDAAHVYSIVGGNDTLFSIDQDGDISVTQDIDDDEVGQYVLTVQVDDQEGGTDLATVTIDLNNVNDDPEGELPDQEDNDSDAISIDVSGFFSDVDSDQSGWSFSSSSLPPGLSISSAGVISGTIDSNASDIPDNDDNVQVYTVTVTLDDGDGGSVDATFDWTINNLAPEFDDNDQGYTGGGDEGITSGTVVASVSASNPDSDVAHVYSIVGGNDTLFSIDQDGDISVTQDIDDDEVGQYVLTVQVDDQEGGTDLATVTIDLNNVDDPTQIMSVVAASVDEANLPDGTSPDNLALTDATGNYVVLQDVDGVSFLQMKDFDSDTWVDVTTGFPVVVNTQHGYITVTGLTDQGSGTYHLEYSFTLDDNVVNPDAASASALESVMMRTDSESAGSSWDIATIIDDEPLNFTADHADEVDASNDPSPDLNLNFIDGADGTGTVVFTQVSGTPVLDDANNQLSMNGQDLVWVNSGTVLTAETEGGMVAFTFDLNGDGTYNFTANNGVISNGTETTATDLSSIGGGNDGLKGIIDISGTDSDVLLSTTTPGGTINTNSNEIGNAAGQSFANGDDVRLTFMTDLVAPADKDSGFTGTDHQDIYTFKQEVIIKGNASLTAVLVLAVYVANGDLDPSDDTLMATLEAADVSVYDENGAEVLHGVQGLTISDDGSGLVTLTGVKDGWTYEINTDEDRQFNAVEVTAGDGDNFKLGSFTFGQDTEGDPIDLTVNLAATDGDDDPATGTISATIYAEQEGYAVIDGQSAADDVLVAADNSDHYLLGYGGNDTLIGQEGDDLLYGGVGNDTMTGNDGSDTFLWIARDYDASSPQTDTITDFQTGVGGDVLGFKDVLPENADTALELSDYLHFSDNGSGGTLVQVDADGAGPDGVGLTVNLSSVSYASLPVGDVAIIQQLLDDGNLSMDV
jgi:hypothetical protein